MHTIYCYYYILVQYALKNYLLFFIRFIINYYSYYLSGIFLSVLYTISNK